MSANIHNNSNLSQQSVYNEHNQATPVAEEHTYHTIWDECFDEEIEKNESRAKQ